MRLIVPFTAIAPETMSALGPDATGMEVEFVDVSRSERAYFDLLEGLWRAAEDFCVVEQDIVIAADTIARLNACPRPWCAAPYPYLGSPAYAGLGCTRFRAAIMREQPDLFTFVARHNYDGHCERHWCTLDAAIQRELAKAGVSPCLRHAPVGHLHSTPTHGCVPA